MKTIHTLFLLCFILFLSCTKQDDDLSYPDCLQERIDYIVEEEEVSTVRRRILKYHYNNNNNRYVYVLTARSHVSDEGNHVMDKDCNTVCNIGGAGVMVAKTGTMQSSLEQCG